MRAAVLPWCHRYYSAAAYGLSELVIEIWWEWEIFGNLGDLSVENGYDLTTRGISLSMVFAHWLYWSAAIVKELSKRFISQANLTAEELEDLTAEEIFEPDLFRKDSKSSGVPDSQRSSPRLEPATGLSPIRMQSRSPRSSREQSVKSRERTPSARDPQSPGGAAAAVTDVAAASASSSNDPPV